MTQGARGEGQGKPGPAWNSRRAGRHPQGACRLRSRRMPPRNPRPYFVTRGGQSCGGGVLYGSSSLLCSSMSRLFVRVSAVVQVHRLFDPQLRR